MQGRHKHNKYLIVQQIWAAIDNYMFRPSGGHHQVVLLKLKIEIVLISTSEEQPDDGHLRAETCSCQQQPKFAIQLNICCVYDGPTYVYIAVSIGFIPGAGSVFLWGTDLYLI